jgi:hypothetical protein
VPAATTSFAPSPTAIATAAASGYVFAPTPAPNGLAASLRNHLAPKESTAEGDTSDEDLLETLKRQATTNQQNGSQVPLSTVVATDMRKPNTCGVRDCPCFKGFKCPRNLQPPPAPRKTFDLYARHRPPPTPPARASNGMFRPPPPMQRSNDDRRYERQPHGLAYDRRRR